MVTVESMDGWV